LSEGQRKIWKSRTKKVPTLTTEHREKRKKREIAKKGEKEKGKKWYPDTTAKGGKNFGPVFGEGVFARTPEGRAKR